MKDDKPHRDPNDLKEWSESMIMLSGREYAVALSPDGKEMARYIEKADLSIEYKIPSPESQILPFDAKKWDGWRSNMRGIAEQTLVTISIIPYDYWRIEFEINSQNKKQ